jgi:hypothetical protein
LFGTENELNSGQVASGGSATGDVCLRIKLMRARMWVYWTQRSGFLQIELVGSTICETFRNGELVTVIDDVSFSENVIRRPARRDRVLSA